MEAGRCVICRRDNREKTEVALEELEETVGRLMDTIQKEMLESSFRPRQTYTPETFRCHPPSPGSPFSACPGAHI